jgi:hypothetical protein
MFACKQKESADWSTGAHKVTELCVQREVRIRAA